MMARSAARCSICGAPLQGQVCEYCGTRAAYSQAEFRSREQMGGFASQARERAEGFAQDMKQSFGRTSQAAYGSVSREAVSTRSKWIAFVLCLLLGRWGVHRLYVGKIGSGLLYMCTKGFFRIGVILDLILILTDNFTDGDGLPLKR